MTEKTSAPAPHHAALLIIDMINAMDFPGAEALFQKAQAAAERIADLRAAAEAHGVPVVYVNDNHGEWHSDREKLIEAQLSKTQMSRALGERLRPDADDIFVLKPQFSGFYATNLPVLLPQLGVTRLILTGVATDICVLFTAADAHMREYELWVPRDCTASEHEARTGWALEIMQNSMQAETAPTPELPLGAWLDRRGAD